MLEGVFLGAISKAFESQWDGIVFQAILATIGVFFATLALYVFDIVKVTKKFQMVVIGATCGIFLLYVFGALLSLFGVDVMFWNEPSALGIAVSVVIVCVAALNLFLDYEFIRRASTEGAPKYMEWYGGVRDHGHARLALPRAAPAARTPARLTNRATPPSNRRQSGAKIRLL